MKEPKDRPFSLLVKPTSADCNLRCGYCFYLDRATLYPDSRRHRMSREVLERTIGGFMATEQPRYSFGWQGGEPTLMGLDFFKAVVELQQRLGRAGVMVANGLQTNGTLIDDEWAAHLARHNFLVGVSIDGPPEAHDRYRVFVDGRGAHAEVLRGVGCLKRAGAEFNVLTLVSQANVRRPRETYRYLRDELGVLFHQYIECVEFDAAGVLQPFAVSGPEWGDFLCAVYDEWRASGDERRVSVRLFDGMVTMLVDKIPIMCTMGRDCRQYLVVEHNGDVYPCDFYVEPVWKLGNLMHDSWAEMQAAPLYGEFGRRKRLWNERCDECPHVDLCAGCCPKNRHGKGADPRALSVLCEGWLRFFDHARPGLEELARRVAVERAEAEAAQRRELAAVAGEGAGSVGRNAPCPCGSGLKFKRCCGRGR